MTADPNRAHRFTPESAVAFRDHWRRIYQGEPYKIVVETLDGVELFERDKALPNTDGEDHRQVMWFVCDENIIPDTPVALMPGYLIRPARRPEGRCWCLRSCDVASLGKHQAFETIYGQTPDEVIERAKQAWGNLLQPGDHPNKNAIAEASAARRSEEFRRSQFQGRTRPGDIR